VWVIWPPAKRCACSRQPAAATESRNSLPFAVALAASIMATLTAMVFAEGEGLQGYAASVPFCDYHRLDRTPALPDVSMLGNEGDLSGLISTHGFKATESGLRFATVGETRVS
jgi:hypothetical protein